MDELAVLLLMATPVTGVPADIVVCGVCLCVFIKLMQ